VNTQRTNEASISRERKDRLNALGFIWDALGSKWENGFQHLLQYRDEKKHCNVPQDYVAADGFELGSWVDKQRRKRNTMPSERRERLKAIGFIFEPRKAKWEEGFHYLQTYANEHKNCRVSDDHVTADGYELGDWVRGQRRRLRDNTILAEQKDRLDAIGFIWDVDAYDWEVGFSHLQAYVNENEHCRVLSTHITADGYPLGQWVKVQRRRLRKNQMTAEQKDRLDALGFVSSAKNDTSVPETSPTEGGIPSGGDLSLN
jgi:hypothetical protein